MATKRRPLVPAGSTAPSGDVPWCKGLDVDKLYKRAERSTRGTIAEAMRLAYLAGARDGALESARGVAEVAARLIVSDGAGATSSVNELWKIMHDDAGTMGAHCLRMRRLMATHAKRDAKLAKKGRK